MFKFTIYTCHAPLPSLAPTRQTYPVAGPLTPLQTPNNAPSLIARLMLATLLVIDINTDLKLITDNHSTMD